VIDGKFQAVKSSDYAGKYLVVLFYPADFSFVCPTELTSFSDALPEFHKAGAEVVAVSVDSKFSHYSWTKKARSEGGLGDMQIPLISDITKKISRDYGVLIEDGPDAGLSLRGLFIIDGKGKLRQMTVNDLPVGRSVDETLRLIQAFQYTDTHGEVCPAGWKPGSASIVPDPATSLKYFKDHAEDL
jgi:peroxiredoxin (alkyl hydroperoxide reductase subunit C)